jgi:alpha-D-xyloside xylohydrolase
MSAPYRGIEVSGDHVMAVLATGLRVRIEASVPVPGVLRMRCRPASLEFDAAKRTTGLLRPAIVDGGPARLTQLGDAVQIHGEQVDAVWHDGGGFSFGAFRRFDEPSGGGPPFVSGYRPAADDGGPCWTEIVQLAPDCGVYGGGESYQGINLRGRTRRLRNTEIDRAAGRNTAYLNVPLLWTDAGWGVFVNSGATVTADIAATHSEAMRIDVDDDELDVFVIAGDPPTILRRYGQLTGPQRMLPDWAFGVWMSRSSYFTADEMVSVADELSAADCPADVMHVDEWLDQVVLDTPAWTTGPDRSRFPAGWTKRLRDRGIRTSVWINPYVGRGTALADQAVQDGFVTTTATGEPVGAADNADVLPIDFLSAPAKAWFRDRLVRTIGDEGIHAVLADFGEELAPSAVLADGSGGPSRHNSYGNFYAEAVAQAGDEALDGDFVAIFRSGTAGAQRYGAHWAGDLPSEWTALTSTLRALLSLSLSGLSIVTCDAGGYWTPESYRRTKEARATMAPGPIVAEVNPELYVRWTQLASLLPLMRFHGVGAREPTAYPQPARDAAISACRFRKMLQDYVITVARTAAETGTPMMRPMVLAYPGDRAARDADLQYLLGPELLVAPITEPGGTRSCWIPPGHWVPLCGAGPVVGPGWITVECELDQYPVWSRLGADVVRTA